MSVIYITEHNENIYSIGEKESSKRHKKTPKFGKNVEETGAKREKDIKTEVVVKKCGIMGPPNQSLPDPSNFLKKKSKTEAKAKEIHEHERFHCMKLQKLPSIPHLADLKQDKEAKEGKKKNFISENIKYVLSKKPKEPEKRVVIDRYGESKELSRGLEPIHIYSSTFGRTPRYLQQLIKTKERDLQLKKDIYGTEQPKCRYITREERENLLAVDTCMLLFKDLVDDCKF